MVIMNQGKSALWNFNDVTRLVVNGDGKTINITASGGSGGGMGEYRDRQQCQFVLGMVASAYQAGEEFFQMPSRTEVKEKMKQGEMPE